MQGYPAGKRAFRAWVRPAAGAGTAGSGYRLPAPAGSRRLGGAPVATAPAAPVAALR